MRRSGNSSATWSRYGMSLIGEPLGPRPRFVGTPVDRQAHHAEHRDVEPRVADRHGLVPSEAHPQHQLLKPCRLIFWPEVVHRAEASLRHAKKYIDRTTF